MISRLSVRSRALLLGGCQPTTRRLLRTNPFKGLEFKLKPLAHQSLQKTIRAYEEFTGMDEVRIAQNRAAEAHNQLIFQKRKCREHSNAVAEVAAKMAEIRSELLTVTTEDDRCLQLITEEHDLLKTEERLKNELASCEAEQRDSLDVFSRRLTESHEKERTQVQRMRYLSIAIAIGGMILTGLANLINNSLRTKEIKMWVSN